MTTRPFALALVALGSIAIPASAQTDVAVEVGASEVRPPLGVDGAAARFVVGGIRASHYALSGSGVSLSALAGRVTDDAAGGDFVSGALTTVLLHPLALGWSTGLEARAFAFDITAPFPYRAYAVEGGPVLRFSSSSLSVRLQGTGGIGTSTVEVRRRGDRVQTLDEELWRLGGRAEVLFGGGPVLAGLSGGAHETAGGTYSTGGGRVVWAAAAGAAEVRLDVWRTPLGTQTTGGLTFVLPVRGWSLRGFAGRSEPDPLTLAEPGGGSGGVLIGRSLFARGSELPSTETLATVLDRTESGARVRIAVGGGDATRVELLGDFSSWAPLPMNRSGDEWVIDLEIAAGTHHFGFLVDGTWFVPEDAPDVVSDDWGRQNATLVIER